MGASAQARLGFMIVDGLGRNMFNRAIDYVQERA